MAQQTAVDWYYEQTVVKGKQNYYELLEQAKQIEKQQIINAFDIACEDKDRIGKEYYNETYGVQK